MIMNKFKHLLNIHIHHHHYNYQTNGENIFRHQNDYETYVLVNMLVDRAMILFFKIQRNNIPFQTIIHILKQISVPCI